MSSNQLHELPSHYIQKSYQFESIDCTTSEDIARRISIPDPPPRIILLVGPCRSGTTVNLLVFRGAGITPVNNPIKTALQRELQQQAGKIVIPQTDSPLLIKESLGSFSATESTYNPLRVLELAGYPLERIDVITTMREPLSTFSSWVKTYGDKIALETLLTHFTHAFRSVYSLFSDSHSQGLRTTAFVYEALRDHSPRYVISSLFRRLDISYTDNAITGWEQFVPFGPWTQEGSGIVFFAKPDLYSRPHTEKVSQYRELKYFAGNTQNLTASQIQQINEGPVPALYVEMKNIASMDLHLSIA